MMSRSALYASLLVASVGSVSAGFLGTGLAPGSGVPSHATPLRQYRRREMCAVAIPGDGLAEEVFVRGFGNFINIYQNLLIGTVLLSWFPQSRGVGALQPLFNVCDPYLNSFRGIIPPIGGIDLSAILAFTLLNVLSGSMASLGAELPNAPKPHYSKAVRRHLAPGPFESFVTNHFMRK